MSRTYADSAQEALISVCLIVKSEVREAALYTLYASSSGASANKVVVMVLRTAQRHTDHGGCFVPSQTTLERLTCHNHKLISRQPFFLAWITSCVFANVGTWIASQGL